MEANHINRFRFDKWNQSVDMVASVITVKTQSSGKLLEDLIWIKKNVLYFN